jgi:hypothetical protein
MSDDSAYFCDLCRLPVEIAGYELFTKEGQKRFCCEGCMGIYRMLHEEDILEGAPAPEAG